MCVCSAAPTCLSNYTLSMKRILCIVIFFKFSQVTPVLFVLVTQNCKYQSLCHNLVDSIHMMLVIALPTQEKYGDSNALALHKPTYN